MGKFTTGVLLFFSFFIFSFEIQAAGKKASSCEIQAGQRGTCYKTLSGGACQFGIELCEQNNCTVAKGRYWDSNNNVCSATKPAETQQVVVAGKKCSTMGGTYDSADVCRCANGTEINMQGSVGQCNAVVSADSESKCSARKGIWTSVSDSGENIAPQCICKGAFLAEGSSCESSSDSGSTNACAAFKKLEADVDACVASAESAAKECNEAKSGDTGLAYSKDLLKTFSAAAMQAKAGSGATADCAKFSLLGSTALNSMDAFKTTCDTQFEGCKKVCGTELAEAVSSGRALKACRATITAAGELANLESDNKELVAKFATGKKACLTDAGNGNSAVTSMLQDLSNSTQQAKICECKTATSNSTACNAIPTAADCLVGGSLYGTTQCQVYGDCSIGTANYSSANCVCLRQGNCTVTPTAASTFAGVDSKAGTSSGTSGFGSGSSGASGDGLDLGGFTQQKAAGTTTDAATAANAGLGLGSSGGGGGGMSAPNADTGAPGAAPVGEEGSGSGGVFGQIKSMFGMGGGSSSKTNAAGSKNTKENPDLKKWMGGQKRCMASATDCAQVNPANKEIFDIMKDRFPKLAIPLDPYLK